MMCIFIRQICFGMTQMSWTFIIRFTVVLLAIMLVSAGVIHGVLDGKNSIIFWIFAVPFILAAPILASVVWASNDELELLDGYTTP